MCVLPLGFPCYKKLKRRFLVQRHVRDLRGKVRFFLWLLLFACRFTLVSFFSLPLPALLVVMACSFAIRTFLLVRLFLVLRLRVLSLRLVRTLDNKC
jgi:hypothetical protein